MGGEHLTSLPKRRMGTHSVFPHLTMKERLSHDSWTTTNPHNPLYVLSRGLFDSRLAAGLFTFLYFHLKTSKFIYFQREARCSEHLEWENHSAWVLSSLREFSSQPLTKFWRHILRSSQMCDWGIQYHLCSTYRGLWGLVVVRLSWLSGRTLAAQARGVLGSTPGGCRLFTASPVATAQNCFVPPQQTAYPSLHLPPSLNDPHVLGDDTIYVIMQASSQQMGTIRCAVVLVLPHLTLPPLFSPHNV